MPKVGPAPETKLTDKPTIETDRDPLVLSSVCRFRFKFVSDCGRFTASQNATLGQYDVSAPQAGPLHRVLALAH